MKQPDHTQRSRTPKCISANNPVPMRLTDEEKAVLSDLAARESRSVSAMARLIFLKGISAINAE